MAQDSTSLYSKVFNFPDKLFGKINGKAEKLQQQFISQSEKYLHKLAKQERKLKRQLAKKDSAAANRLFANTDSTYQQLTNKFKNETGKVARLRNVYNGHLDSVTTSLNFLKDDKLAGAAPEVAAKIKESLGKLEAVQGKFNQAEAVQQFLKQRQQYLKEQLSKYGLAKTLAPLQKQVYYYRAQMDEYKKMWESPSQLEAKAIQLLSQTEVFRDFFNKNSQLASLFRLPGSSASPVGGVLATGLQTRASLQQDLMQRFGSGPNVQRALQQGMGEAQAQINQVKDQLNKLSSGGGRDVTMPDFKPNNQKTKSFLQRLEYGTNVQTAKSNYYFPVTSDLGLSVGYKIDDKKIVGIGASYKMGWGKDIRHISISHQGLGLRSFVDLKIKGGFWISGGGELNYRSQFSTFSVLNDFSPWQKSALLGLKKKYQVRKKLKGNVQLLYDFLYKQQVPVTQPVVFRVGYNF